MIRSSIRRRKSQKAQINGVAFGGSSFGYGIPSVDLSSLRYVPYDAADQTTWLIPDKPIRAAEGIRSDKDIVAAGDVVAYSSTSNVYVEPTAGGAGNLFELSDVGITNPKRGDMLVFDGIKWVNAGQITIDCGNYRGIN